MEARALAAIRKMNRNALSAVIVLLGFVFATGATPAAEPAPAVEPSQLVASPIAYADLAGRVGARLAIETTFNTVRRGTLIKYTKTTLTLRVDPAQGGFELSVPSNTIRSIRVIEEAAPAAPPESPATR